LHDNGFQVWDTLAIAEFLHDAHPDKALYPADKHARARARSISAEMHSGFGALRGAMPMNIKLPRLKGRALSDAEAADVARIDEIFVTTRREFAGGKPYLFGDFSVADAMFAPMIWRLFTYNVPLSDDACAYRDSMLAHPAMKAWAAAAVNETTALAHYDDVANEFGGVFLIRPE
jgi:glutathione S-transferase